MESESRRWALRYIATLFGLLIISSLSVSRFLFTSIFIGGRISRSTGRASMEGGGIDFDLRGAKRQKVRKGTCKSSLIEIPWISQNILSFLEVPDVLSLGSCSKQLNGLFNSDEVWKELYKRRWQDLPKNSDNIKVPDELSLCNCPKDFIEAWKERYKRSLEYLPENNVNFKGWKTAYSKEHKHQEAFICNMLATHSKIFTSKMLATATESEPLLHFQYLRAINDMEYLKLGFEDIYLYFFRKDINVVFNLLGLHYSYFHLGLPLKDLRKVLATCQVSDKEVCVSWGLCRTREFDFYIPEEEHYRITRLGRIADNDVALLHMLKEQDYQKLYDVEVSSNVLSNE